VGVASRVSADEMLHPKQFHGSDAELKPGDKVLPRSITGVRENAASWRDTSQNITTTAHLPEAARYGKHVYVVEPHNVLGRDPEYGSEGAAHRIHPQAAHTYDSESATVIRKVSPEATARAKEFHALPRHEGQPLVRRGRSLFSSRDPLSDMTPTQRNRVRRKKDERR
jgi:hypothetical protein